MSHPMKERPRTHVDFWVRVNTLEAKLKNIPLSKFTAEAVPHLYIIMSKNLNHYSSRDLNALEYLEKRVEKLKKKRARSSAKDPVLR